MLKLIHSTFKDQDSFIVSHLMAKCAGDDESAASTMAYMYSLILNNISDTKLCLNSVILLHGVIET